MEPRKVGELWIIWKNAFKYSVKEEKAASRDVMDIIRHLINVEIVHAWEHSQLTDAYQQVRRRVLDEFCIPKKDWQDFTSEIQIVQGGRNDMKGDNPDRPRKTRSTN